MSDITTRLRRWTHDAAAVSAGDLMDEAAAEIERLRGYRDEAESEAGIASLALARLRLTDEEREAIAQAAMRVECLCQRGAKDMAATLRGLLERLG
jgi:hypothetical protein